MNLFITESDKRKTGLINLIWLHELFGKLYQDTDLRKKFSLLAKRLEQEITKGKAKHLKICGEILFRDVDLVDPCWL